MILHSPKCHICISLYAYCLFSAVIGQIMVTWPPYKSDIGVQYHFPTLWLRAVKFMCSILNFNSWKGSQQKWIETRNSEEFGPSIPPPCEQISICRIFRPLYFKTRKTYKADIYQPNSKYSKDFRNNIQTHSHFSNGLGSPLKVSDLFKNGKLFSVFCIFRTLIPQDAKVAQPSRSSMSKSFM